MLRADASARPRTRSGATAWRTSSCRGAIPSGWPTSTASRIVFIAPGDFAVYGIATPADLEKRGRFRLVYADAVDYRVYEIVPAPP